MIKTIRNAMKIRDMAKCLEEFEQLCRAFLKSKAIVDKEGVPQFYVRLLADLEDYLNQVRVITKDTSLYFKKKKKETNEGSFNFSEVPWEHFGDLRFESLTDTCGLLLQLWEDKEGKKKMNKNNAKALSTLRQKIRKYNRDFETEIATYKEVGSQYFKFIIKGLPDNTNRFELIHVVLKFLIRNVRRF